MFRSTKIRGRKSRSAGASNRAARSLDAVKMRRYLAFVRAVVGVTTKAAAR